MNAALKADHVGQAVEKEAGNSIGSRRYLMIAVCGWRLNNQSLLRVAGTDPSALSSALSSSIGTGNEKDKKSVAPALSAESQFVYDLVTFTRVTPNCVTLLTETPIGDATVSMT